MVVICFSFGAFSSELKANCTQLTNQKWRLILLEQRTAADSTGGLLEWRVQQNDNKIIQNASLHHDGHWLQFLTSLCCMLSKMFKPCESNRPLRNSSCLVRLIDSNAKRGRLFLFHKFWIRLPIDFRFSKTRCHPIAHFLSTSKP